MNNARRHSDLTSLLAREGYDFDAKRLWQLINLTDKLLRTRVSVLKLTFFREELTYNRLSSMTQSPQELEEIRSSLRKVARVGIECWRENPSSAKLSGGILPPPNSHGGTDASVRQTCLPTSTTTRFAWLLRGLEEIFPDRAESDDPSENLEKLLAITNRPLRVKLGIDPTGADIHLGHSIPVRKLRAFQDAGHKAVLIIGDFTARIGDPTGKSEVRRQLTAEMVAQNAKNYLNQVRHILDFDTPGRLEVRYNSEWLEQFIYMSFSIL